MRYGAMMKSRGSMRILPVLFMIEAVTDAKACCRSSLKYLMAKQRRRCYFERMAVSRSRFPDTPYPPKLSYPVAAYFRCEEPERCAARGQRGQGGPTGRGAIR